MRKTRIVSMKAHTIPRLELMSGEILARLMASIKTALEPEVKITEIHYCLDSKTVLCWVNNRSEWKLFVRHGVNEILNVTRKDDWGYCPREQNLVDPGSRGFLSSRLKRNE